MTVCSYKDISFRCKNANQTIYNMKGIAIFYVYVFILAVLIVLAPNDRFALIGVTVYSIISTALLACFIESESKE